MLLKKKSQSQTKRILSIFTIKPPFYATGNRGFGRQLEATVHKSDQTKLQTKPHMDTGLCSLCKCIYRPKCNGLQSCSENEAYSTEAY